VTAIALIPARSGSGRLRNKNIRPFLGHPMLAYAVAAARNSGLFSRVILSTDSEYYGEVGEYYGAEVLLRPADLATSTAGLVPVAQHAIQYAQDTGTDAEILCQLMPCCPLRRAQNISDLMAQFVDNQRSFQLSMLEYIGTYPEWAMVRDGSGCIEFLYGRDNIRRSQELAESSSPSGAIWLTRIADFLNQGEFYGQPLYGELLPMPAGIDIDTLADFEFATALALGYEKSRGASVVEPIGIDPWQIPPELIDV